MAINKIPNVSFHCITLKFRKSHIQSGSETSVGEDHHGNHDSFLHTSYIHYREIKELILCLCMISFISLMPDERSLFGKEMVISCCCTYIQTANYDTSLCFPKAKQTTQKQWQRVPWSRVRAGCLILLVTAKTEPLFSSREKQLKNPTIRVLSETPAKLQEGADRTCITVSVLLKETVRNLACRQREFRTEPDLIKPAEEPPEPKAAAPVQDAGLRGAQPAPFCLLMAVVARTGWTGWLGTGELNNAFIEQHKYLCSSASWMLPSLLTFS